MKRSTSPRDSGKLAMTPVKLRCDLVSDKGNRLSRRWLIVSVVKRKNAGIKHHSLKSGLSDNNAVIASKTCATVVGSVNVNRNGETAPAMSRAQNFNDPPLNRVI